MKGKFLIISLIAGVAPMFAQAGGVAPLQLIDKNQAGQKVAPAVSEVPLSVAGLDQAEIVQRYGSIVSRRPLGAGGLTAWTVEKNGRRVVLYTTADGQAVISGIVWESMSGRNLTDQLVPNGAPSGKASSNGPSAVASKLAPVTQSTQGGSAALVGKYSGAIPESIKTIDTLAGIKEGKGGQADTLYVIFDPRCPYCRKAYNFTREYVKRGFTIKWIPAVVLGDAVQGTELAAAILQAKPEHQAEALRRGLGNKEEVTSQPTKSTAEALERNAAFFFAAFQNNRVDQAGVPVAFFLDKRTGKPRMMTGISELPVIEEVFGKL